MAAHPKTSIVLYIFGVVGISFVHTLECDLTDECLCYQPTPSTYEFHCPPDSPKIITSTNLYEVKIECMTDINWENFTSLPKLDIDGVSSLKITKCPVPEHSLDKILLDLGLNSTASLTFSHSTNFIKASLTSIKRLNRLKVLNISKNNIEELAENQFQSFTELTTLDLSSNSIKTLASSPFANLSQLMTLNLSNNMIKDFSGILAFTKTPLENLDLSGNPINLTTVPIDELSGLKKLRLSNTHIDNIPENFFAPLDNLEDLDLSNNRLSDFSDSVFHHLTKLKSLNLENNLLTQVSKRLLINNGYLRYLNVGSNKISIINTHAFQRNTLLNEIILAKNKYKLTQNEMTLGISPFQANFNLERLDLSGNRITDISEDWLLSKIHLRTLDLSHNEISAISLTDLMGVSANLTMNLNNNKISTVDFRMAQMLRPTTDNLFQRLVLLKENPLQCDCLIYDFVRYFDGTINPRIPVSVKIVADNLKCAGPKGYINKPVTALKANSLTCNVKNCPKQCSCGFRAWDRALVIDCANRNLNVVPTLQYEDDAFYKRIEVDLHGNLLTSGPCKGMGYENVSKLNLAFNNISEFSWTPSKLQVLNLTHNNLQQLDEKLLYMFNGSPLLSNLLIGNNPWRCGCSVLNLRSFLITHLISKRMIDADNIRCQNDGRLVIHLSLNDVCMTFSTLIVMCSLILALMASIISILTCICAFTRKRKLYSSI